MAHGIKCQKVMTVNYLCAFFLRRKYNLVGGGGGKKVKFPGSKVCVQ